MNTSFNTHVILSNYLFYDLILYNMSSNESPQKALEVTQQTRSLAEARPTSEEVVTLL